MNLQLQEPKQRTNTLKVSVIVPVRNGGRYLVQCLEAVRASSYPIYECVVVDDTSTDDSRTTARRHATQVLELKGGPFGPAYARNRGADVASGDILLFVDADVVIGPDTVAQVAESFEAHPKIDAVFGSYDDQPAAGEFASQFKNLFHHFVHQHGREDAVTFWSGCGAVRRDVFLAVGGFDEKRYRRPSIEDIELGQRLNALHRKVVLIKDIQVKHLKRWTLKAILKADFFDRAIPWTQLIIQRRDLPNDLNLRLSQRVSALLLCILLLHLSLSAFFHHMVMLPLLAALFLLLVGYMNLSERSRPFSRMSWKAELLIYALIGSIAGLSLYFGLDKMLIPLALLFFGTLVGRWNPTTNSIWKYTVLAIFVAGFAGGFILLLASFSVWLLASMFLIMLLVVLLNFQLYLFFARKRGILFALAVVPFHFFYYIYSVAAFVVGTGLYALKGRREARTSSSTSSQTSP